MRLKLRNTSGAMRAMMMTALIALVLAVATGEERGVPRWVWLWSFAMLARIAWTVWRTPVEEEKSDGL